jgi:hypothetical protein
MKVNRTRLAVIVLLIGIFGPALPNVVHALQMDFHGEGTRLTAGDGSVEMTRISSPDTEDRQSAQPVSPDREVFDEFNVDVTGSVYHTDITGNESRSFKTEGSNAQADVSVEALSRFDDNEVFEFNASVRGSDDPQVVQGKEWKLRGMYGEFREDGRYRLRLGNVSADFSDYSLSSSSDVGLHYVNRADTSVTFQGYLSRSQRQTGGQYQQLNGGVRIEGSSPKAILREWGLNTSYTEDQTDSLSGSNQPRTAIENRVTSFDFDLAVMPDWRVDGELAQSTTDTNTRFDTAPEMNDWAYKLQSTYRIGDTGIYRNGQLNLYYEEVQPDFRSTSGGGSPDQRRFTAALMGTLRTDLVRWLPNPRTQYRYSTNSDNLDDQLARETKTTSHRFSVDLTPFDELDANARRVWGQVVENTDLSLEFGHLDVETSDTTISRESVSQSYDLETRIYAHDLDASYSYRKNLDFTSGGINRRQENFRAGYEYNDLRWLALNGDVWPMDVRARFRRTVDWQTNGSGGSDRTNWDLGSTIRPANNYRLNLNWRFENTDNNGPNNDVERTTVDTSLDILNLYRGGGQATLSYLVNDIDEQAANSSYREEVIRADVGLSF